ncbi:MAG: CDP-diacylglycerol--glycerol-3-phosphate 3-phosphatidyltransferase [Treponema sp.]|nr:CDP-diacylglycerol--glycerol-3-phosphate 3-phosphatidyltransferase [Treponema sp.]
MNLANKLTLFRIILAPVFLVIFLVFREYAWTIPVLWIIFIVSEVTDYFDGFVARKFNQTSDFGKLFDPFADTLVQITYFLCFIIDRLWGDSIFPVILFLLIIYREFGILFLRNLMLKKGITLGASIYGKIKTVAYIVAVGAALLVFSLERQIHEPHTHTQAITETMLPYFKTGSLVIFALSVLFSIISFFDYLSKYKKTESVKQETT